MSIAAELLSNRLQELDRERNQILAAIRVLGGSDKTGDGGSDDTEKIFNVLERNGGLTQASIARRTGIPVGTLPRKMRMLVNSGQLIRQKNKTYVMPPSRK